MKKYCLDFKKYITIKPTYVLQTYVTSVLDIKENFENYSLNLKINFNNIIGNAYEKNELLNFAYKVGKKIYKILKPAFKNSIYPEITTNKSIFDINKITSEQKKQILTEFKDIFSKYDLITKYYFTNIDCSEITIPFYSQEIPNNLLNLSEKFVIFYFIYELYKLISILYDYETIYQTLNIDKQFAKKELRKIQRIVNLFLKDKYFINYSDNFDFLIGFKVSMHIIFFTILNNLTIYFNISLYPFNVYNQNDNSYYIIMASDNIFDTAYYTLLQNYSSILTQDNFFNLFNYKRFTCPICNQTKIKNGKRDIMCSECRKTPKGRNYIRQTHINNKKQKISTILENFAQISNPPLELKNKIKNLKNIKINDHTPTIKYLNSIQNEINIYIYQNCDL